MFDSCKNNVLLETKLKQGSLWGEIKKQFELPFFKDIEPDILDLHTINLFGDRILFNKYENLNLETLSKLIVANYREKWKNYILYDANNIAIDSTGGRRLKETVDNNAVITNNGKQTSLVSGFNSEVMVADTSQDIEGKTSNSGKTTREVIEENIDINSVYQKLDFYARNSLINWVMQDISNFLSLNIYIGEY